ncbi:hypothetical protein [Lentzea sp. NPDC055074]
MSVLDAFGGLLGGSGKNALPVVMADGEAEVTRVVASFRPGGFTSVGGDLVLTTKRLVFTPLNVTDVVKVMTWALGKAGAPDPVAGLPEKLGELVEQEDFGGLPEIARVEVGGPPKLLMPPTLVISGADGAVREIGVLASRTTTNASPKNAVERDRMAEAIRAAMR